MKVFLDTNILLDYGQVREEFLYAKAILELGEQKEIELYASYLSYANMGYILRHYPKEDMWLLINDMRKGIHVLSTDSTQLDNALRHTPVKDYEDLLQYLCATEGGCEMIVTNNKRDFLEFSKIPIYTSKEFLYHYFKSKE
ncbi:MAG: PIN domain-containing protein [Prevotella sp.]|nr:PIN domain-containing protein [Prevotella sp.]